MTVAAVQLDADLADVYHNMALSLDLITQAAAKHANLVVLPEFFTSAMALNPLMEEVARRDMELDIPSKFRELSSRLGCVIAGSYLNIIAGNIYNSLLMQFPNGDQLIHNKDIPTQFENRYYTDGDHLRSKNRIGAALCWEMIRSRTVEEMPSTVRIVAAGSCWWDLSPDNPDHALRGYNHGLNRSAPSRLAGFLGIPVVHSSHVGVAEGFRNSSEDSVVTRQLIGRTQVVDLRGQIQNELQVVDGNAVLVEEVELPEAGRRTPLPEGYWSVDMPSAYIDAWERERSSGRKYYLENRRKMIGNFAS